MVKGSDVVGIDVVALENAKKVSSVKSVLFDKQQYKVLGLKLSGEMILLIQDIKSIGKDAVMVSSKSSIKKKSDVSSQIKSLLKSKSTITDTKLLTEKGTKLGSVKDIIFDPQTGDVKQFEVSEGLVKEITTGKKTVPVQEVKKISDKIIIAGTKAKQEIKTEPDKGVKGALGSTLSKAKQKAPKVTSQAIRKGKQLQKSTSKKINQVQSNPKVTSTEQKAKKKTRNVVKAIKKEAKQTL